jgi:predicted RNA-binding Zn-ribbon protein involved in translation (DUF1610 family)
MEWFDEDKNAFVKPTKDELLALLVPCSSCGSTDWKHERSDIHGVGYRCSNCNKFGGWSGKGKGKAKNPKFAARHKQAANGVRTCAHCGISEVEAKECGWHFTTDHILAEEFGGEDTLDNTQSLCSLCHYEKTVREHRTRGIKKFLESK